MQKSWHSEREWTGDYLYFPLYDFAIVKSITKVQKAIESEVDPTISVRCPYCGVFTAVNRTLTEPKCMHFEDFTLFKLDRSTLTEIDGPRDLVVLCEAIFRLSGSRHPNIVVQKNGELVLSDEGIKIMANGKFEGYLSQGEFVHITMDDEDSDYVREE